MLSRLVAVVAAPAARTVAAQSRLIFQRSLLSTASSQSTLIVNAVGIDRLGIVSEISKHVTEIGGNVGESQATKLGAHFSMLMLVHVPAEKTAALEKNLADLDGVRTAVFETEAHSSADEKCTPKIGYSGSFELEGANYPGIVHKVTTFLAKNGLSVDRLETSQEIAPHGGTTLFKMKGVANALEPLAAGFNADRIKADLALLGDELNCNVSLKDNL